MHSFVTSKNAQWPRLIWPTLYIYIKLKQHNNIINSCEQNHKLVNETFALLHSVTVTG